MPGARVRDITIGFHTFFHIYIQWNKGSRFIQKNMKRIALFSLLAQTGINLFAQAPANVEAVDLGLPSGTLWASCDLGSSSPEVRGDRFAWGETTQRSNFNWDNYFYSEKIVDSNGFEDYIISDIGNDISGTQYDAATVIWGDGWRMPTKEEYEELISNCIWNYIPLNGINGYKVTSKINDSYIFLPISGDIGSSGDFWTSTCGFNSKKAFEFDFEAKYYIPELIRLFEKDKCGGSRIRPVTNKAQSNYKEKCASPIITYTSGRLEFYSTTPGSHYQYSIISDDITKMSTTDTGVDLAATYNISVYAFADGYYNSETVSATLCWLESDPKTEGINDLTRFSTAPVLISSNGNALNITGADNINHIEFYNLSGSYLGAEQVINGEASFETDENLVIVKIGEKSIKVKK